MRLVTLATLVFAVALSTCFAASTASVVAAPRVGVIAFDDDTHDVWRVNADGSERRRLTTKPAQEFDPSWSPGGTKIAYRSEVDGNSEIYVMNADGSNQINVTNDPGTDYSPAWSPDGRSIAFACTRGSPTIGVCVMDPDGANVRRLAGTTGGEYPTWSPDSRRIAFARPDAGNWAIFVTSLSRGGIRRVVRDGKLPAWSPRGSWIAYQGASRRDGRHQLGSTWLVRPDGRRAHRILKNAYAPTWSPDGTALAVSRLGIGLVAIDLSGRQEGRITPPPAIDAAWIAR